MDDKNLLFYGDNLQVLRERHMYIVGVFCQ
jgi:hypothetical protein